MPQETINYHLTAFDGPLDLLLHLISKNKVSIYDIPIAEILVQFNEALDSADESNLERESEFVSMSAQLLYIKSKMLLPSSSNEEEDDDPRASLVQMLLEYQRFKEVSGLMHNRYEIGRDIFVKQAERIERDNTYNYKHSASDLRRAVMQMLEREDGKLPPPVSNFSGIVGHEVYSVGSKVAFILKNLLKGGITTFKGLFSKVKTRSEVVATFLAILELCKSNKVRVGEGEQPTLTLTGEE
ncbi:MAG: segregation/condensation protein A [Clostridia bacterium]